MQVQRWGHPTAFTHPCGLSLNYMQTTGKPELQSSTVCGGCSDALMGPGVYAASSTIALRLGGMDRPQTFIHHYRTGMAENSKIVVYCGVCMVLSECGTIAHQECRGNISKGVVPSSCCHQLSCSFCVGMVEASLYGSPSRRIALPDVEYRPAWETGPLVEGEITGVPLLGRQSFHSNRGTCQGWSW